MLKKYVGLQVRDIGMREELFLWFEGYRIEANKNEGWYTKGPRRMKPNE